MPSITRGYLEQVKLKWKNTRCVSRNGYELATDTRLPKKRLQINVRNSTGHVNRAQNRIGWDRDIFKLFGVLILSFLTLLFVFPTSQLNSSLRLRNSLYSVESKQLR